jgi:hypothetical protein
LAFLQRIFSRINILPLSFPRMRESSKTLKKLDSRLRGNDKGRVMMLLT